jgi:hypothetical protein
MSGWQGLRAIASETGTKNAESANLGLESAKRVSKIAILVANLQTVRPTQLGRQAETLVNCLYQTPALSSKQSWIGWNKMNYNRTQFHLNVYITVSF